jgi:hypothetical protein
MVVRIDHAGRLAQHEDMGGVAQVACAIEHVAVIVLAGVLDEDRAVVQQAIDVLEQGRRGVEPARLGAGPPVHEVAARRQIAQRLVQDGKVAARGHHADESGR